MNTKDVKRSGKYKMKTTRKSKGSTLSDGPRLELDEREGWDTKWEKVREEGHVQKETQRGTFK